MNIIDYIFWFSFWGIVYPFAIYPVLLFLLKNIFSKDVLKSNLFRPEITILIAAHNEEKYIEDCIKSILNSDYPKERISVIVGSDASTDKTNSILEVFSSEYTNIVFYKFDRIGKNAVINKLYEYVKSDYVFFFDTDCRVEKNTISTLVDNFADENVGGVMSSLTIQPINKNNNSGESGEIIYQKFEFFLRLWESNIWSISNALGAMYGMRREIIDYMPNLDLVDDMFNVLNTAVKRKRFVFEPLAITTEVREKSLKDEIYRRERLYKGSIFSLIATKKLFSPIYGWSSFFMYSHKFIRLLMPYFIIFCVCSSLFLNQNILIYKFVLKVEILFFALVVLGMFLEKMKIDVKILKLPLFFISLNIGYIIGIKKAVTKATASIWTH